MADPSVKGLLYDVDSSGGESAGCLEAARFIAGLRGTKPMWSVASPQAASAAYALASASDRVITSQQGDVGSIGVLGIHVDRSGELTHKGHKVTIFQKGARKAEGNPFGSLSEEATKNIDARLDGLFNSFVDLTCANRNLKPEAVRSLEGATFSGQEAQKMGLVDAVMDPREAVTEFREYINSGTSRSMGVVGMHGPNAGGAGAGLTNGQERGHLLGHVILGHAPEHVFLDSAAGRLEGATIVTFTQADLDRARSEGVTEGKAQLQAAVDTATASGFKDGAVAERARLSAILDSDEAKDRPTLARHLAFETDMSVDQVRPVLTHAAKEVKEPVKTAPRLEDLRGIENPNLGAGEVAGEEDELGSLLKDLRKIEGRE
jgi:ClpP class serine protease